jgi:predicted transcriptional regulator
MPSWVVKNRLDDKDRAKELFSVIKDGNHTKLLDYPGAVRDKIAPDFTNGEALSTMVKSNLDVIVVVDENNWLKGVVQRDQVLTRMVLALTPTK